MYAVQLFLIGLLNLPARLARYFLIGRRVARGIKKADTEWPHWPFELNATDPMHSVRSMIRIPDEHAAEFGLAIHVPPYLQKLYSEKMRERQKNEIEHEWRCAQVQRIAHLDQEAGRDS